MAAAEPIPLAEIAEHDGLPLAYLEHLVARLRKAGLVDSRRGSRGGYMLARSAHRDHDGRGRRGAGGLDRADRVHLRGADGSIVCSRESDPAHVCPTKLLWTRVRFSIVRTLRETTLADPARVGARARRGTLDPDTRPPAASFPRRRPRGAGTPTPDDRSLKPNMADLEIRDLHVRTEDREILRGVDLDITRGEIHALMGPNGSGKSTLANTLLGHPAYEITEGTITFKGEDITEAEPHERAKAGLFLAFQYPVSIPGVSVANFLRMAINAKREEPIQVKEFRTQLQHAIELLDVDRSFTSRHLNDGFSGGEKKRAEILQMAMLAPDVAILDETDSGLDIDALRTVAEGVQRLHDEQGLGALIITHYQRILHYVKPEFVHILMDGRIVLEGGVELVERLEREGYDQIRQEVGAGEPEGSRPVTAVSESPTPGRPGANGAAPTRHDGGRRRGHRDPGRSARPAATARRASTTRSRAPARATAARWSSCARRRCDAYETSSCPSGGARGSGRRACRPSTSMRCETQGAAGPTKSIPESCPSGVAHAPRPAARRRIVQSAGTVVTSSSTRRWPSAA